MAHEAAYGAYLFYEWGLQIPDTTQRLIQEGSTDNTGHIPPKYGVISVLSAAGGY